MRRLVCLLALLVPATAPAQSTPDPDKRVYERHDWFALRDRLTRGEIGDPLIAGATAAALGQEARARTLLDPVLAGPHAAEAHGWLSYIDMRAGHYRAAAGHIASSDPGASNPLAETFAELPDQVTLENRVATIRYRVIEHKLFVPVRVAGRRQEYILDSDANLSFMSETAARSLGLKVRRSDATTAGALGAASRLSITTADIVIGRTRLRGVAFMVLPDTASLFATLKPARQGALGLPVLLALRRLGWDDRGNFTIGRGYDPRRPSSPLAFDGADPVVLFAHDHADLTGVLDTGAETTNLWPPFANRFATLLAANGRPGMKHVRGFGGDGQISETILPSIDLLLGGGPVTARPAHILTAPTTPNSGWLSGRMGLDLLLQARRVTIDFNANRLQLAVAQPAAAR